MTTEAQTKLDPNADTLFDLTAPTFAVDGEASWRHDDEASPTEIGSLVVPVLAGDVVVTGAGSAAEDPTILDLHAGRAARSRARRRNLPPAFDPTLPDLSGRVGLSNPQVADQTAELRPAETASKAPGASGARDARLRRARTLKSPAGRRWAGAADEPPAATGRSFLMDTAKIAVFAAVAALVAIQTMAI